ncbi:MULTISPECIES: hypothetical protein [Streptacidiphilus]|uniref:Uncharacterized protein n=1 Tax=Streptacidiphilus cavernicola TaxID=3342716 RepID=A0ABV6UWF1_9ACTN|nr:hypothetical protein [Streptacidiphilus jeojiense]
MADTFLAAGGSTAGIGHHRAVASAAQLLPCVPAGTCDSVLQTSVRCTAAFRLITDGRSAGAPARADEFPRLHHDFWLADAGQRVDALRIRGDRRGPASALGGPAAVRRPAVADAPDEVVLWFPASRGADGATSLVEPPAPCSPARAAGSESRHA